MATVLGAASFATAYAQTLAQLARPGIFSPMSGGTVQPPVLFQWTTVFPGRVTLAPGDATHPPTTVDLVNAVYEVQISDAPDVDSDILLDVRTTSPSYLFTNQIGTGAFTARSATPLGGHYYWRVRAVFGTYTTAFSAITPFTISTAGGTTTPNHQMSLFSVAFVGTPSRAQASQITAVVGNVGTYTEHSGAVRFVANGEDLGSVDLPQMAPGERVTIAVPYVPGEAGEVQLSASLTFADANPKTKSATASVRVLQGEEDAATMQGTLRRGADGVWYLTDERGERIVTLVEGKLPLAAYGSLRDTDVFASGKNGAAGFAVDTLVATKPVVTRD